jgi:hypothetical protein
MKKIVISFVVLILALSMCTIMFAQASPIEDKNNDKFQAYSDTGTFKFLKIVTADHQYIPSKENVNRLVISYEEAFLSYDITVGSNTYTLGADFTYSGYVEYVFYDVTAWYPISAPYDMAWPTAFRASSMKVDYMFDFSGGDIEGTLQVHAVSNAGGFFINSLVGTGDLQNVQIKATLTGQTSGGGIITVSHAGIVSGWPE